MNQKIDKGIILKPGIYTPKDLYALIVKQFLRKSNGKEFKMNDIYQYILKGNIPPHYGGNTIINIEYIGVKTKSFELTGKRVVFNKEVSTETNNN
jgi:hypothetical protein